MVCSSKPHYTRQFVSRATVEQGCPLKAMAFAVPASVHAASHSAFNASCAPRRLCATDACAWTLFRAAPSHPVTTSQRAVISMAATKGKQRNWAPRVDNRIARMRYEFLETYECGVELVGTEIKSVRTGKMNIREGYARVKNGELFLHNVHISPWDFASKFFNHDPTRPRKLLLHKRSIRKLESKQGDTGLTIVPISAYFNSNGYLKVEVALARGKQLHDRREDIKRRDDAREMQRVIKSTLAA